LLHVALRAGLLGLGDQGRDLLAEQDNLLVHLDVLGQIL
jgi:hypothetical protein